MVAGVVDRGVEHGPGDALAARRPGDDEADDRPDRAVVDRREDPRCVEPLVVARGPRLTQPTARSPVVREQAGAAGRHRRATPARRGSSRRSSSSNPGRGRGSRCTSTTWGRRPPRTGPRGRRSARGVSGTIARPAWRPSRDGSRGPCRGGVRFRGSGVRGRGRAWGPASDRELASASASGVGSAWVRGRRRRRVRRRRRRRVGGGGRRRGRRGRAWRRASRSASASSRPAGRSFPVRRAPRRSLSPGRRSAPVVSGAPVAAGSVGSVGVTPVGNATDGADPAADVIGSGHILGRGRRSRATGGRHPTERGQREPGDPEQGHEHHEDPGHAGDAGRPAAPAGRDAGRSDRRLDRRGGAAARRPRRIGDGGTGVDRPRDLAVGRGGRGPGLVTAAAAAAALPRRGSFGWLLRLGSWRRRGRGRCRARLAAGARSSSGPRWRG